MHHRSLFTCRPLFTCRFLGRSAGLAAGLSVFLAAGLTPPSTGQDPQPRSSASSENDTSGGMAGSSADSSASDSGTSSETAPQVGVDTAGRADAVATRNGRTTRQRRPAAPPNPLVLTDPSRSPEGAGTDSSAPYSSLGTPDGSQAAPYLPSGQNTVRGTTPSGNRFIPPVVTRDPADYTLSTDPSAPALRRTKPLPLFGYDFFQPARQIIIARRRALLPPAPRPVRYNTTGRNGARPGQINSQNSNSASYSNPGGYDNSNGYNPSGNSAGQDSGAYGIGADAALLGAGAAGQALRGGNTSSYNSGQAGAYDSGSADPGQNGLIQNSPAQNGDSRYPNSQYPNSQYPNGSQRGADGTGGYSDPLDGSGDPLNTYNSSAYNSNTYDSSTYNSSTDMPGAYTPGSADGSGSDLPGDVTSTAPRRRQSRASSNAGGYLSSGGDGFPGDTGQTGTGSQFPGDDALLRSGTANAITGQIADPLSTLSQNVLASLPPNYQLQPGDSLSVRYSALALAPREFTATVDLQGGIDVEGIGRVVVAGRTATQAEAVLRQRLGRLYRNVDASIDLRQLRTIQVTVSGAAFAPGTYTVPATATAFNVLNAAGGPTADGSLRDIRVLRGGRRAGTLDIYPLVGAAGGSPSAKNGDVSLQAGDNIYIPGRLSRIAVSGEVRQPAVYELTTTENLRDALRYAGGVKPSGVDQNVHIDTIDNGLGRVIKDVNLRDKAKVASVNVFDGDTIEVSSVRSILTNRVTISGAVDQPGDYALTPGMTAADLIARARGVLYNTYQGRAELTRLNSDNTTTVQPLSLEAASAVALKRFDILRLFTDQEVSYLGRRLVTVRGAVQRPGLYTQSRNMRVSDLLLDSGGPLPDAYTNRAVLLHQRGDGTYAYDYVNLAAVIAGDASMDLPVEDNDVLAVYRIGEAHFTPDHTVKILGNVLAPGLYARGEGMRLSDLLKQSGAFKPGGGTRVTVAHARRPVTDKILQVASVQPIPQTAVEYAANQTVTEGTDLALQDGDVVAVQGDGSLRDHPAVVTVTGMVNRPGPIIIQQGMRLSDAIKQAGSLRPEAFPQGAEFTRTTDALVTGSQLDLAAVINRMSDMLNLSQAQRERAKANLALIEAAGSAASGSSSPGLPGLGGSSPNNAANPNLAPLIATLPQNNLVSPARLLTPSQLRPNGAVAVQLAQAIRRPGSLDDVLLKDGDTLVVPETPTTVQVVGAVFSARGVVFRPGQSIDYYIQRAGDYTPDAAKDRIEVIHAGGGLIPASKAGALQPGDLILVPTKVLAEKISRSGSGFSDFFQGLVGSAITLKVLGSVFGL